MLIELVQDVFGKNIGIVERSRCNVFSKQRLKIVINYIRGNYSKSFIGVAA